MFKVGEILLKKYNLIKLLGRGGMGDVYLAENIRIHKKVAIKILRKEYYQQKDVIQRFHQEAVAAGNIGHPNIAEVYDMDITPSGEYFIVMEFLQGSPLNKVIKREAPLTITRTVGIIKQCLSALKAAHDKKIVHRDIKPENIFLIPTTHQTVSSYSETVKLLDFGIAKFSNISITRAGNIIGTPRYISPEQAGNSEFVDHRTDIFSLGAVMYEMLTLRTPYSGDNTLEILSHILMKKSFPNPSELNKLIDDDLENIIIKSLKYDIIDRYQNVAEFYNALDSYLQAHYKDLSTNTKDVLVSNEPIKMEDTSRTIEFNTNISDATLFSDTQPMTGSQFIHDIRLVTVIACEIYPIENQIEIEIDKWSSIRNECFNKIQLIIVEFGGEIEGIQGNNLTAIFGVPTSKEDDIIRALRSVLKIMSEFKSQKKYPIEILIGIETGRVLYSPEIKESGKFVGDVIATALNIKDSAYPDTILIGHESYINVRGKFQFEDGPQINIKRGRKKIISYFLIDEKTNIPVIGTPTIFGVETHLIGREMELMQIKASYHQAIENKEGMVVSIIGSAGIGKTRLVYEFINYLHSLGSHVSLYLTRCQSINSESSYSTFFDLIKMKAEILYDDPPNIAHEKLYNLIYRITRGQDSVSVNEIKKDDSEVKATQQLLSSFMGIPDKENEANLQDIDSNLLKIRAIEAIIKLFRSGVQYNSKIIFVDDAHFMDKASLEIFQKIINRINGPIFIVFCARPEFGEIYKSVNTEKENHNIIQLGPLSIKSTKKLFEEVLKREIPHDILDILVSKAEGNPYYIEEICWTLANQGILIKNEDDRWTINEPVQYSELGDLPKTIEKLIQARIDSLNMLEKHTIRLASVIGKIFWISALQSLGWQGQSSHLVALQSKDIIVQHMNSKYKDTLEYEFKHQSFYDVVYKSIPSVDRNQLHRMMAKWLQDKKLTQSEDYALIAHHYEIAEDYENMVLFCFKAGNTAYAETRFNNAVDYFNRIIDKKEYLKSENDQFMFLYNLGTSLSKNGEHLKAEPILQNALTYAKKISLFNEEGNILCRLALGKININNYEDAKKYLDEVDMIFKKTNNPVLLCEYYKIYAFLEYYSSKLDDAITYWKQSLELGEKYKLHYEVAVNAHNIAHSYVSQNKQNKALKYLEISLNVCQENGFKSLEMVNKMLLSIISFREGNKEAIDELKELAQHANNTNYIWDEIQIRYELSLILEELKNYDDAKVELFKIISLSKETGLYKYGEMANNLLNKIESNKNQ